MKSTKPIKKGQIEDYISDATKEELLKYQLKGEGSGGGLVSCTLEEAQLLVNTNALSIGSTYEISGVHKGLFEDNSLVIEQTLLIGINVTNAGSGYSGVLTGGSPLTGGSGTGASAYVVIQPDGTLTVDAFYPNESMLGYQVGDILTIAGSGGTGFEITVREEDLERFEIIEEKGQTIYLTALTTNRFSDEGFGKFYNPKYLTEEGFGIFTERSTFEPIQEEITTRESVEIGLTDTNPTLMVTDNLGNVLVACSNSGGGTGDNGIINMVAQNNLTSVYCEIPDESPIALKWDNTTNALYVLTLGYVYIVTGGGTSVQIFGETGSGVNGSTGGINGDGYPTDLVLFNGGVFVSKRIVNKILYLTRSFPDTEWVYETVLYATVGDYPCSMLINGNNDFLFVACMNDANVYKVSLSDATTTILGTTDSMPMQIVFGNDGNIYSVNMGGGNITKIIKSTGVSSVFAEVGNSPRTILLDGAGYKFYVVSNETKSVKSIDQGTGAVLSYAENVGNNSNAYPYSAIKTSNGRMFVTDYMQNKIFEILGQTFITLPIIPFNLDETITADNGATGKLVTLLESGEFLPISGDWETAISIVGDESGAVAILEKGGKSQYSYSPYNWSMYNKEIYVSERQVDATTGQETIIEIGSYNSVNSTSQPWLLTEQLVNFINNNATANGVRAEYVPNTTYDFYLINTSNVWKQIRLAIRTIGSSNGTSYMYMEADPKTSSVRKPNFAIAEKTIYGGYVWENLTGEVGNPDFDSDSHELNLDSTNWKKIPYDTTNYNLVIDKIKYDYSNNFIFYRSDKNGLEVEYTKKDQSNLNNISTISTVQWGNYDSTYGSGTSGNKYQNSYVIDVNFRGSENTGNIYINSKSVDNIYSIGTSKRNNRYVNSEDNGNYFFGQSFCKGNIYENSENNENTYVLYTQNLDNVYYKTQNSGNVYNSATNSQNVHYHSSSNTNNMYGQNVNNSNNIYHQFSQNQDNQYKKQSGNSNNIYDQLSSNNQNIYGEQSQNNTNNYKQNSRNNNNTYEKQTNNVGNYYGISCNNENNTYKNQVSNSKNTYGNDSNNVINTYGIGTQNNNNIYGEYSTNSNNTYSHYCNNEKNIYENTSSNNANTYGDNMQNSNNTYVNTNNSSNTYGLNNYNNYNRYDNATNQSNTYGNYVNNNSNVYGKQCVNSNNVYDGNNSNNLNTYGTDTANVNNHYGMASQTNGNTFGSKCNNSNNIYGESNSLNNNIHSMNVSIDSNVFGDGVSYNSNSYEPLSQMFTCNFGDNSVHVSNKYCGGVNSSMNTFGVGSVNTNNTYESGCVIQNNTFSLNTTFVYNVFGKMTTFQGNILPSTVQMIGNNFEYGVLFDNVISLLSDVNSVMFSQLPKIFYRTPSGLKRVRYYNDENVLVIADTF